MPAAGWSSSVAFLLRLNGGRQSTMIPISLSLGEIFNRTKALSRESGGDPTFERESRRRGVHVAENLKCMENRKAGPQHKLETE